MKEIYTLMLERLISSFKENDIAYYFEDRLYLTSDADAQYRVCSSLRSFLSMFYDDA